MIACAWHSGSQPEWHQRAGWANFLYRGLHNQFLASGKWNNKAKTFTVEDSLSYQVGRHLWKFGGDISAYRSTTENAPNYGSFSFNSMFTGSPFADFLWAYPPPPRDPILLWHVRSCQRTRVLRDGYL